MWMGQGFFGTDGGAYPWDGDTDAVAVFLASVGTAPGDIATWTAQQAYTAAGAATSYALAQSNASARPSLSATGLDGFPCIEFDGIDEFLNTTDANFLALFAGNDSPITVILWLRFLTVEDSVTLYQARNSGDSGNNHLFNTNTSKYRSTKADSTGASVGANTGLSVDAAHRVITDRRLGTTVIRRIDGIQDASDPQAFDVAALTSPGEFRLGAAIAGTQHVHARIGGAWVVRSDNTTLITAIEEWILARSFEYYSLENQSYWHDSVDFVAESSGGVSWRRTNPFARVAVTTDAETMHLEVVSNAGAGYYYEVGVTDSGAFHDTPTVADSAGTIQRVRVDPLTPGSKLVELWNGPQRTPGAVVGTYLKGFRVPKGTAVSIATATQPTNRLVIYGDSISQGSAVSSSAVSTGWTMRARLAGNEVAVEGQGSRQLFHDCETAPDVAAFADKLEALLDGTGTNTLWLAIGTNDYGNAPWTVEAFEAAYDDLIAAMQAKSITGLTIYCQTPLTRGTETANGLGDTMAEFRTAISNVVSNYPGLCTLVDGPSLVTHPTNFAVDGVHPNDTGHSEYWTSVSALL